MFLIYTTFICFKQSYNVGRYLTCSALESTASSERLSRFDKVTRCPVTTCQDKQQAGQCSPRTHGPLQYQEYGL